MTNENDDNKNIVKKIVVIHPGSFEADRDEEGLGLGLGGPPSKPISVRTRSLSFSGPVRRDDYLCVSASPAASFLSEFTHKDDNFDVPVFSEGKIVRNYLIGQILGGGGFSECREAYALDRSSKSTLFPEKVALKIVSDPRYAADFRRELQIWKSLDHPNILPLLEYFAVNNYQVAVSVLAEKGNLQNYVAKHGKITEMFACDIFSQVVQAVQYLHETMNTAHLDLKLENILLTKDDSVYLCDFGMSYSPEIVGITSSESTTSDISGQFCSGSITSLPPETLLSDFSPNLDDEDPEVYELFMKKKQDVWALGVLLYAMIVGKLPFSDEYMPRLQHSIISCTYEFPSDSVMSTECRTLISKILVSNPKNRPSISDIVNSSWVVNCSRRNHKQ